MELSVQQIRIQLISTLNQLLYMEGFHIRSFMLVERILKKISDAFLNTVIPSILVD